MFLIFSYKEYQVVSIAANSIKKKKKWLMIHIFFMDLKKKKKNQ